jgi:hypothetical protein
MTFREIREWDPVKKSWCCDTRWEPMPWHAHNYKEVTHQEWSEKDGSYVTKSEFRPLHWSEMPLKASEMPPKASEMPPKASEMPPKASEMPPKGSEAKEPLKETGAVQTSNTNTTINVVSEKSSENTKSLANDSEVHIDNAAINEK